MANTQQFLEELARVFEEASAAGRPHVDLRAGDLHRRVGGYPGPRHRMPVCCGAMRSALDGARGDRVLSEPPSGQGARLTIRYLLPRPEGAIDHHPIELAPRIAGSVGPREPEERTRRPHVHPDFLRSVEMLHDQFEKLSLMAAVKPSALPGGARVQGVYLFSEGARPMYVGRTKNLKQRIGNHCGRSSRENQAVFAFKLAREATGKPKASYTTEGSRAALMAAPAFAAAFKEAKE